MRQGLGRGLVGSALMLALAACSSDGADPIAVGTDVSTAPELGDPDAGGHDAGGGADDAGTRPPIPGPNHPCTPGDGPGSDDSEVTACTCAADTFCCDVIWDETCVDVAAGQCGALCDCVETPTSCAADSDCAFCDEDGDPCTGGFACDAGTCVQTPEVVCDPSAATGCAAAGCNPSSGLCEPQPDHALCDDDDFCTDDTCVAASGECAHAPIEGCGLNHPCKEAETPGSNDPEATECVCGEDEFCCLAEWDAQCADTAKGACGIDCDCGTAASELTACAADEDCGFCDENDDACDGTWACVDGQCGPKAPVTCDTAGDNGCLQNTCDPTSGACAMAAGACDDGELCTTDSCNTSTGQCSNEPIDECSPTCEGACAEYIFNGVCQCDAECFEFDDCCPDICAVCSAELGEQCAAE